MKLSNLLPILLLAATVAAAEDRVLDHWTGTVESRQGTLYLIRCDLAKTNYRLTELDPSSGPLLSQLDVRTLEPGQYLVARIVAEYRSEGDQNILAVEGIETAKVGESCHLPDSLPGA